MGARTVTRHESRSCRPTAIWERQPSATLLSRQVRFETRTKRWLWNSISGCWSSARRRHITRTATSRRNRLDTDGSKSRPNDCVPLRGINSSLGEIETLTGSSSLFIDVLPVMGTLARETLSPLRRCSSRRFGSWHRRVNSHPLTCHGRKGYCVEAAGVRLGPVRQHRDPVGVMFRRGVDRTLRPLSEE